MITISVSKFRATCLKVIDTLSHTGEPVLITKYGKAVAMLIKLKSKIEPEKKFNPFGSMKGSLTIHGDIVSPIGTEDWEALQ